MKPIVETTHSVKYVTLLMIDGPPEVVGVRAGSLLGECKVNSK